MKKWWTTPNYTPLDVLAIAAISAILETVARAIF